MVYTELHLRDTRAIHFTYSEPYTRLYTGYFICSYSRVQSRCAPLTVLVYVVDTVCVKTLMVKVQVPILPAIVTQAIQEMSAKLVSEMCCFLFRVHTWWHPMYI
jgi:hypothetical protein